MTWIFPLCFSTLVRLLICFIFLCSSFSFFSLFYLLKTIIIIVQDVLKSFLDSPFLSIVFFLAVLTINEKLYRIVIYNLIFTCIFLIACFLMILLLQGEKPQPLGYTLLRIIFLFQLPWERVVPGRKLASNIEHFVKCLPLKKAFFTCIFIFLSYL